MFSPKFTEAFGSKLLGAAWNSDANPLERDELILDIVNEDPNLSIRDFGTITWAAWNFLLHENLIDINTLGSKLYVKRVMSAE